jgi:hypothetical protein
MNNDAVQNQNPPPNASSGVPISANPFREGQPMSENLKPIIEPSLKAPEIPQDVEAAGIRSISDELQLTKVQKDAGIELAKESSTVSTQPTSNIKLPLTPAQAEINAKGKPTDSSTWLGKIISIFYQKKGGQNA